MPSSTGYGTGRLTNGVIHIYLCVKCGRVRRHGKWIYLTPQEKDELGWRYADIVWIKRDGCLKCAVKNENVG